EVRVGSERVGAQRDADAAFQELAERVRRMAECRVRAGAISDRRVRAPQRIRGLIIRVSQEHGRRVQPGMSQPKLITRDQLPPVQNPEVLEERDERARVVLYQFPLTGRFEPVDRNWQYSATGHLHQRPAQTVWGVRAQTPAG